MTPQGDGMARKTAENTNGNAADTLKRKTKRFLKVMLTADEERHLGKESALQRQLATRITDEFDGVKADFKSRLERCEAEQNRLSVLLNNGYELRDVECEVISDFKSGQISVVRLDTGEEVEVRPMTEEERQRDLPISSGA